MFTNRHISARGGPSAHQPCLQHPVRRLVIALILTTLAQGLPSRASEPAPSTEGGVVNSQPASRRFEFRYEAIISEVPQGATSAYLWIPYPPATEDQTIRDLRVDTPLDYEVVTEPRHGNRALRFAISPATASEKITLTMNVTRHERVRRPSPGRGPPVSGNGAEEVRIWLEPDRLIPLDDQIRAWAEETTAGQITPLGRARAIYDHAVTNLKYEKTGTGWGQGDIHWACDTKRGNCTDFHALVIGYSRAVGIPARFEMGFPLPRHRGNGEIGGYHCWVQLYLDGHGWLPLDASEAHKNPSRREYFFGAHDENRILFTVGRDLTFPGMRAEPLNYFIYPYAEVDGRPHEPVEQRFFFRDLPERSQSGDPSRPATPSGA